MSNLIIFADPIFFIVNIDLYEESFILKILPFQITGKLNVKTHKVESQNFLDPVLAKP